MYNNDYHQFWKVPIWQNSENPDFLTFQGKSIVIDGEQEDEDEEEGCRGEEVPDVVVVEEVQDAARIIQVPRLGRRQVPALVSS